jgi:hypothetical protein
MANNFPTAPPDAAGGLLVIAYGNGLGTHHIRAHIPGFYNAAPATGPNWDSPYDSATGDNGSIRQTAIDLIDAVKGLFTTDYAFWVSALYQKNTTTGKLQLYPTLPVVGAEAGTVAIDGGHPGAPILATDAGRFLATTFSFRTAGGHRYRLSLVGAGNRPMSKAGRVSSSSGGLNYLYGAAAGATVDQGIVGYLTGVTQQHGYNTAILGHDGTPLIGVATELITPFSRQRREAGFTGLSRAQV